MASHPERTSRRIFEMRRIVSVDLRGLLQSDNPRLPSKAEVSEMKTLLHLKFENPATVSFRCVGKTSDGALLVEEIVKDIRSSKAGD